MSIGMDCHLAGACSAPSNSSVHPYGANTASDRSNCDSLDSSSATCGTEALLWLAALLAFFYLIWQPPGG